MWFKAPIFISINCIGVYFFFIQIPVKSIEEVLSRIYHIRDSSFPWISVWVILYYFSHCINEDETVFRNSHGIMVITKYTIVCKFKIHGTTLWRFEGSDDFPIFIKNQE